MGKEWTLLHLHFLKRQSILRIGNERLKHQSSLQSSVGFESKLLLDRNNDELEEQEESDEQ